MHRFCYFVRFFAVSIFIRSFCMIEAKDILVSTPDGAVMATVGVYANQPKLK